MPGVYEYLKKDKKIIKSNRKSWCKSVYVIKQREKNRVVEVGTGGGGPSLTLSTGVY